MITWILIWLYFRLEFSIDWGGGSNLIVDLLPTMTVTVSPPDMHGFKLWSLGFHFLIFGVVFQYYYPSIFKFDELGDIVGKNVYPECTISQVD